MLHVALLVPAECRYGDFSLVGGVLVECERLGVIIRGGLPER